MVIINLFGTTLTDKVQRWYDDYMDHHQYCTWDEAKEVFRLRYQEQDSNKQVYIALKIFKQGESEKVWDYYERFMKLIKCLQSNIGERFKLIYFRVGLLDYLRITTSGTTIETLNELKEVAQRCKNNCMDALGWKLILHMKRMEIAPSKAMAMSKKAEGSKGANKQNYTLCKKVGDDDAYCFNNPNNPNNRLSKTKAKGIVAINEVSVHSQGRNVG